MDIDDNVRLVRLPDGSFKLRRVIWDAAGDVWETVAELDPTPAPMHEWDEALQDWVPAKSIGHCFLLPEYNPADYGPIDDPDYTYDTDRPLA